MLMGYGLLAVPTIVGTMEVSELKRMESKPLTRMLHEPISSELQVVLRCRSTDCAAQRKPSHLYPQVPVAILYHFVDLKTSSLDDNI